MKKFFTIMLVLALIASALVGCAKETAAPETKPAETPAETPVVNEGKVAKFGLGQNISVAKSKDAGTDANGNPVMAQAQMDVTMAAVGFDKDGKVVSVTLDVAQPKVAFDSDLKITSDVTAEVKTKKDYKDEYGMKAASGIGKEWYEQAAAFEEWMIGKTIDEIKGLKVKEVNPTHQNVPDIPELTSSVTITVENYIAAVEEAWNKAVDSPGAETVGLGVETHISGKDKGVDANGKEVLPRAQSDTYMSATAFDKDGKVVAALIDNAQVRVNYDAEGKITDDKTAEIKTKQEIKDAYGMKAASAIGKEWYEQIKAFADWMVGKNIDEITGLKVKEVNAAHKNVPDIPELASSVTITVEGYLAVVKEASEMAR